MVRWTAFDTPWRDATDAKPLELVLPRSDCAGKLRGAWGGGEPLLATAEGKQLTVASAVEMVAPEDVPNELNLVRTFADLWIDYTLLATAASDDPTFNDLDVSYFARQQLEQDLILALRDTLVRPDTTVSEEELLRRFELAQPGSEVNARHILVRFPDEPTAIERDSVSSFVEEIRARILAGESFEDLARTHSQDVGSAEVGGDVGWFARGRMVPAFELAAFAMEPGEVSEVVESPFGLHIIRVDDKRAMTLEEARDGLRVAIQNERVQNAEAQFVADVEIGRDIAAVGEASDKVREIAEDPALRLSRRDENRPVVRYVGGAFTVGELRDYLQTRNAEFRAELATATSDAIEAMFLRGMAQRELLVTRAQEEGLGWPVARQDSLVEDIRTRVVEIAAGLGFLGIQPEGAENQRDAIHRSVLQAMREMLRGERDVVPLGAFAMLLRERSSYETFNDGLSEAVAQIDEMRSRVTGAPPPATEPGLAGSAEPAVPDTSR